MPSNEIGAARRPIEAAEDVEQRRLSRAGGPVMASQSPRYKREIDVDERVHGRLGAVIAGRR